MEREAAPLGTGGAPLLHARRPGEAVRGNTNPLTFISCVLLPSLRPAKRGIKKEKGQKERLGAQRETVAAGRKMLLLLWERSLNLIKVA